MADKEADDVLSRAGISSDLRQKQGKGGCLTVVAVALFSSLAGLLMGLDIGYMAGVKSMESFSQDVLNGNPMTGMQDSLITMIFGAGAAVACFPPLMDFVAGRLGRKGTLIVGGSLFCLGSVVQAASFDIWTMTAGRFVAGLSVGLLSGNAPIYTSEIAPPAMRGRLVAGFQFAVTVGIMVAFLLALAFEEVVEPFSGWRWLIAVQVIPGVLLILGGIILPGSPRYLVSRGKNTAAFNALLRLRSKEQDVRSEFAEILLEQEEEEGRGQATWKEFLSGDNAKLLGIGLAIQLLGQLSGMNAFMYDGPLIFERLFHSPHAGRLFTAIAGAVNILATIPAILLVDRFGRTSLMKWSAVGMCLCSGILAIVGDFCLADEDNLTCGPWSQWTATLAVCGFILNFAYGWGGMPWVYCAEMFPLSHRTKGVAATTDANWIGNMLIAFMTPILMESWNFNFFWVLVATNLLGVYCAMSVPETKGKSLEEINVMFRELFSGQQKALGSGSGA
eukprot:CAMPEP_0181455970 /NCGR_PEP_ID=MMETSP1110-20121109/31030_1 /TAXON_ID=174948 /ORGANISM="Symbiodinium sp., Strain CCMP421" /LENGTH=503 /DNA_ID=CAMNT_0023580367 /DNA_START=73 /DNA_END=1584 /DNA_ORIENTATION=+